MPGIVMLKRFPRGCTSCPFVDYEFHDGIGCVVLDYNKIDYSDDYKNISELEEQPRKECPMMFIDRNEVNKCSTVLQQKN